ncbi:hypothetical protein [Kurthia huakuii]|uniref:hypothetical protein n=1 Tax=Kurthia huakuii TaxID=1421019 RepID=UPI0004983CD4|nr:hypothetical protein [Kurthia huakuii]MBM7700459.1 putative membrane protein YqjE [Kurthia huakuii]
METLRLTKVLLVLMTLALSTIMFINEKFQFMPLQLTMVLLLCGVLAFEEWRLKENATNALTIATGMGLMVIFKENRNRLCGSCFVL